jgi:Arc/MetJ-type ribon-helix-helix transcriptional regulator
MSKRVDALISDGPTPVVKTSISLPKILMDFARAQRKSEGYNSLSDLLADLLRKYKHEGELFALRMQEANSDCQINLKNVAKDQAKPK